MSSLFLSKFLREKRREGWTQVKMAELLEITQVHASRLTRGYAPSIQIVIKLADYFGVSTDAVLGRIIDDRSGTKTPGDCDSGADTNGDISLLRK